MSTPLPIDIKRWRTEDRGARIEKFVATAVMMPDLNPINPTQKLIHWRGAGAYILPGHEYYQSTSFDTRKVDEPGATVEVQFISKPFDVSANAVGHWEEHLIKEYTTNDVYNLLVAKKVNQYTYNGEGSGCLTWTTHLIQLLEAEHVLPAGSTANFLTEVAVVRANPAYWVPDEDGAEFYK